MAALKQWLQRGAHAASDPLVALLFRLGVRADHLTVFGLLLGGLAGWAYFDGHFRLGALFLALSGICDILDGQLARRAGALSRFGAFLDSTLDRLAEGLVLVGIIGFYLRNLVTLVFQQSRVVVQLSIGLEPVTWAVVALTAALALVGSFLVSYTRARAEGLGIECRVGWFERPERMVLLMVAGLLKVFWAMSAALLLLAVLSFATAAQRVAHVYRHTRGAGRDH
ncbi:MAG: CDP-alcohol phosphatidyltransferase family protein [Candidatus Eisenbacteria bacterium]|nr:CDP-alcohol phosphatidyltransferase family protein [Candidatus Eisenbacteria bacterium]